MILSAMSERSRNLWTFGFACFFGMWALIVLSLLASPIADKRAFAFTSATGTSVSDFVIFYQAGVIVMSDQHTQIYNPAVQMDLTNRIIAPIHIDTVFYLQYVPFFFPLMVPFAMLPLKGAFAAWYALSLIVGMTAIVFLLKDSLRFSNLERVTILLAVLSSAPAIVALKIGQTSWFTLALFCAFYLSIKHKKDIFGGSSLALIAIKPQYIPLLWVSMFFLQRWKLLVAAAIAEVALLALAGSTVGWDNVIKYPSILTHAETTGLFAGVVPLGMISLRGLLSTLLPQKSALSLSVIVLAVSAFPVCKLWQLVRQKRISCEWAMALTTILCLVVSPHSHVHDLLLLTVPAILTLPSVGLLRLASLPDPLFKTWAFILVSYPVVSWFVYCFNKPWVFLILNATLLAVGTIYCLRTQTASDC